MEGTLYHVFMIYLLIGMFLSYVSILSEGVELEIEKAKSALSNAFDSEIMVNFIIYGIMVGIMILLSIVWPFLLLKNRAK